MNSPDPDVVHLLGAPCAETPMSECEKHRTCDTCPASPTYRANNPATLRKHAEAMATALERLRYPPESGEPERFCDHAAEPCTRCEGARTTLRAWRSGPGAEGKGGDT